MNNPTGRGLDRQGVTLLAPDGDQLSPRSTPAVATVGTAIYVFGGGHDDYLGRQVTPLNDLYAYDTEANELIRLSPAGDGPTPRFFGAAAADEANGHVYVFGGTSYDHDFTNLVTYGELFRYSVGDNRWSLAADPETGPGPRVRPNLWSYDGDLYAFGGLDHRFGNHNDLWRFDTATEQWEPIVGDHAGVRPRYEAVSGNSSTSGTVWAIGGEVMAADFRPELIGGTIEIDLASGAMREVVVAGDIDGGMRHQSAAAEIDGVLHVYGGDDPHNKVIGCGAPYGQAPVGETWSYDPVRAQWERAPVVGPRLKRATGSAVAGAMYVFGGYDFECDDDVGRGQIWNQGIVRVEPQA